MTASGPAPAGTGPAPAGSGPASTGSGPASTGSGPASTSSGPASTGSGLASTGSALASTGSGLAAALRAALDRELADAVRLRHDLHAAPELSGSEYQTAARVAAALGEPDAPQVAGTGRLVRIGPADGPCVAVRAELDALPVVEQTGAGWASANGAMHACGHDVHLAALAALGRAARSVAATDGLPAAMLAVLQPREEAYPSGAKDIAASAAFTTQRPAAVIAAHLQHQVPAGTVSAAPGTVNASVDDFEIVVEGTAGHAGYPHLAVDPVPALCQAVVAVQQIASRRTDPTHAVVVSVGMLQAGQATNVIPGSASARGTLRALDPADRPLLRDWLREIAEHSARSYGCRATVTIEESEPALVNSEPLAAASWPVLREAGFGIDTSFRSCGADDFSFYSPVAPVLMLFVGSGGTVTLHHPEFLPPDGAVGQVATVMLAGYLAALTLLLFALSRAARGILPVRESCQRRIRPARYPADPIMGDGGSRRAVHSKTI
jgi:amidohydrolase